MSYLLQQLNSNKCSIFNIQLNICLNDSPFKCTILTTEKMYTVLKVVKYTILSDAQAVKQKYFLNILIIVGIK